MADQKPQQEQPSGIFANMKFPGSTGGIGLFGPPKQETTGQQNANKSQNPLSLFPNFPTGHPIPSLFNTPKTDLFAPNLSAPNIDAHLKTPAVPPTMNNQMPQQTEQKPQSQTTDKKETTFKPFSDLSTAGEKFGFPRTFANEIASNPPKNQAQGNTPQPPSKPLQSQGMGLSFSGSVSGGLGSLFSQPQPPSQLFQTQPNPATSVPKPPEQTSTPASQPSSLFSIPKQSKQPQPSLFPGLLPPQQTPSSEQTPPPKPQQQAPKAAPPTAMGFGQSASLFSIPEASAEKEKSEAPAGQFQPQPQQQISTQQTPSSLFGLFAKAFALPQSKPQGPQSQQPSQTPKTSKAQAPQLPVLRLYGDPAIYAPDYKSKELIPHVPPLPYIPPEMVPKGPFKVEIIARPPSSPSTTPAPPKSSLQKSGPISINIPPPVNPPAFTPSNKELPAAATQEAATPSLQPSLGEAPKLRIESSLSSMPEPPQVSNAFSRLETSGTQDPQKMLRQALTFPQTSQTQQLSPQTQTELTPKRIYEKILALANDQPQLRQVALNNKEVRDFIFLVPPPSKPIEQSAFSLNIPGFQSFEPSTKKYLYDTFALFRDTTKISDIKCLQALKQYVLNSDILKKLLLPDKSSNVLYLKTVYEVPNYGMDYKLAVLGEEVNRVQTGILNQYTNINKLAMRCLSIVNQQVKKAALGQAITKFSLFQSLFKHYQSIVKRVEATSKQMDLMITPFVENFRIMQKTQQKALAKIISIFSDQFRQCKLVDYHQLQQIITKFDEYEKLDDLRPEIKARFCESDIEQYHQHILVFLLQLDRVRPNTQNIFTDYPKLLGRLLKTKSNMMAPFREITQGIQRIAFNKLVLDGYKKIDYRKVLENVRSEEWTDWMEIYLQSQLPWTSQPSSPNSKVQSTPAPIESLEQTQAIVKAIRYVYKSDRGLDRAWRRHQDEDRELSSILRYTLKLRQSGENRFRYEVLSVLLGNRTSSHVNDLFEKQLIAEGEWETQVLRSMYNQLNDLERAKGADLLKKDLFVSEKKEADAKIVFFTRILELCPDSAVNIEQLMFKTMRERGFMLGQGSPQTTIDRGSNRPDKLDKPITPQKPAPVNYAFRTMIFLVDCLKIYSRQSPLNFRLLKHIFKAFNSIISCQNRQLALTLFISIGLCYKFEEDNKGPIHPCLKFFEQLYRNSDNPKALKTITEIKRHLDLLLSQQDILRVLPDRELSKSYPSPYQAWKTNYVNRYVLSQKNMNDLLGRLISGGAAPECPWFRNILEIVKIGPMDFSMLTRILRKFMVRPCSSVSEVPKILQLLYLTINDISFVQEILQLLEVVHLNFKNVQAKLQSNPFCVENKYYLEARLYGYGKDLYEAREDIQNALGLLHVAINLTYVAVSGNRSGSTNFMVQFLKQFKFVAAVERYLLCKTSLYAYKDQSQITQQTTFNIIYTLFCHLNFQVNRAEPCQFNPSLDLIQYNWSLGWPFRSFSATSKSTKSLQPVYRSIRPHLDHLMIADPLVCPMNGRYECRESVSINALRCINSILICWETIAEVQEMGLVELLSGPKTEIQCTEIICEELLKIVKRYRSSPFQAGLVFELMTIATKKHFRLIEPFLTTDIKQHNLLARIEHILKQPNDDPIIISKISSFMNHLYKIQPKSTRVFEQLYERSNYCLLLVKKLDEMARSLSQQNALVDYQSTTKEAQDVFEAVVAERKIDRVIANMLSFLSIVEIALDMFFRQQAQATDALRILLRHSISYQTLLSYYQPPTPIVTPSQLFLFTLDSFPIYNARNYSSDSIELYFVDQITGGMVTSNPARLGLYLVSQRSSVLQYFNKIREIETDGVLKMFEVVLSTGKKGYFMSTIEMEINDTSCPKLLCHLHQPKMDVGYCELLGRTEENAVDVLRNLCVDLMFALKSQRGRLNYKKTVRLMGFCVQAIRATQIQSRSGKDLVVEMLRKPAWLSEDDTLDEMLIIKELLSAKLLMDVLGLHKFYRLPSDLLKLVCKILQNSLTVENPDLQFRSLLLNQLIYLADQPTLHPLPLLKPFLSTPNPQLFYNTSRVICQLTKHFSLELCQSGLIDLYLRSPILQSRLSVLTFYTNQNERHPDQLSWLWMLQIMKCLVIYGGESGFVVGEVVRFANTMRDRIVAILAVPALLGGGKVTVLNYGYMEELEAVLGLIEALVLEARKWVYVERNLFENVLFVLLHKTMDLFVPKIAISKTFSPTSETEKKLSQTSPPSSTRTYQPQPLNYSLSNAPTSLYPSSYSPNMFQLSIQLIYFNIASHFLNILTRSLQHTQFVECYFDEPIDRVFNNCYQNFIWTRLNRRIPELQQYLLYIGMKWGNEQQMPNLLTMYRDVYRTAEVFAGNGYLTSIRVFWEAAELMAEVGQTAWNSLELGQVYLKLQLKFKNKYFALLTEDLNDFKNAELQMVNRFAETFRKFNQAIFLPLDCTEALWPLGKANLDSIRIR